MRILEKGPFTEHTAACISWWFGAWIFAPANPAGNPATPRNKSDVQFVKLSHTTGWVKKSVENPSNNPSTPSNKSVGQSDDQSVRSLHTSPATAFASAPLPPPASTCPHALQQLCGFGLKKGFDTLYHSSQCLYFLWPEAGTDGLSIHLAKRPPLSSLTWP